MTVGIGLAFAMATLMGVLILLNLAGFQGFFNPLFIGFIAGVIVGNPSLGLAVGASCSMMALGFYTYGGATIPDYNVGALFGVLVAQQVIQQGGEFQAGVDEGIVIGSMIALLMTLFDILGRFTTFVFQHGGDRALAKRNVKSFERWTLAGVIPWFLGRFIPVFIGMLFIDQYAVIGDIVASYAWFQSGLQLVGRALPAVGFGLLLSYMDIKGYWMYMLLGYVAMAYLGANTIALAIIGVALAGVYMMNRKLFAKKEEA